MKFICIFSVRLWSFAILKPFLTQFWQFVFAASNRSQLPVIPLAKGWSVASRLRHSKSNMRIFKCNYAIFYLRSFTFTIILAGYTWFLELFKSAFFFFFWNKKLFGGFRKWPIPVTVNLHLSELFMNWKLFSLAVLPFNSPMPGCNKRWYILEINSIFWLEVCLSVFDLLLPPGIERLK